MVEEVHEAGGVSSWISCCVFYDNDCEILLRWQAGSKCCEFCYARSWLINNVENAVGPRIAVEICYPRHSFTVYKFNLTCWRISRRRTHLLKYCFPLFVWQRVGSHSHQWLTEQILGNERFGSKNSSCLMRCCKAALGFRKWSDDGCGMRHLWMNLSIYCRWQIRRKR